MKVVEYEICARRGGLFREDCRAIVKGLYLYDGKNGALITETIYDKDYPEDVGKTNVFCSHGEDARSMYGSFGVKKMIGTFPQTDFIYIEDFELRDDPYEFVNDVFGDRIAKEANKCFSKL